MKIVHLSTYYSGGAGIAARRLHEGLLDNGVDSNMLVAFGPNEKIPHVTVVSEHIKQYHWWLNKRNLYKVHKKDNQGKISELASAQDNYEVFTFARTDYKLHNHPLIKEADIIHLHWVSNFIDYPTFFKNVKKPIVWTFHDLNPIQGGFHYKEDIELNPKYDVLEEEQKSIKFNALQEYNKDLRVVALSNWIKNESKKHNYFGHRKHHLIRNGVDTESFKVLSKNKCRLKHNIPLDKPVFVFMCENIKVRRKGFDILLDSISRLSKDAYFIAIGNKTNLDIDIPINFTGFIHSNITINEYLSASDAFLLPSREDNLPNVMVESLLAGTPIIAFNTGGIVDIVKNGKNGVIVENIDSNSFFSAINHFMETEMKFDSNKMSQEAREHFDANLIVKNIKSLYSELI